MLYIFLNTQICSSKCDLFSSFLSHSILFLISLSCYNCHMVYTMFSLQLQILFSLHIYGHKCKHPHTIETIHVLIYTVISNKTSTCKSALIYFCMYLYVNICTCIQTWAYVKKNLCMHVICYSHAGASTCVHTHAVIFILTLAFKYI